VHTMVTVSLAQLDIASGSLEVARLNGHILVAFH
jgi:hypothetical protein